MNRYSRHIILSDIGLEGQEKVSNTKVLVIGAGGLGCPVLQYLVAAGVGTIGIVDFDIVEESNLQRQILFGTSSLGENKAIAAKKRLQDLNPNVSLITYPEALTPKNALYLFKDYDIIVDGSDNFDTRYLVNDAAVICNKPFVYGAIYKFEGQVSVFNYKDGPTYRCLFPNPPSEGSVPNCSEIGVLGVLPGIIGAMQANEVLKMILGFKSVLSGKLYCYDAKTTNSYTLKVNKIPSEIEKVHNNKDAFEDQKFNIACNHSEDEIHAEKLLTMDNIMFIDVRETHEQPQLTLENCIQIPLGMLENRIDDIDKSNTNIVVCQSGIRSLKAVTILKEHNIHNCYSLKNGISSIMEQLKII